MSYRLAIRLINYLYVYFCNKSFKTPVIITEKIINKRKYKICRYKITFGNNVKKMHFWAQNLNNPDRIRNYFNAKITTSVRLRLCILFRRFGWFPANGHKLSLRPLST